AAIRLRERRDDCSSVVIYRHDACAKYSNDAGSNRPSNLADRTCRTFWINLRNPRDVVIGERPLIELSDCSEWSHDGGRHRGVIKAKKVPNLMREHALNIEFVGLGARREIERRVENNVRLVDGKLAAGIASEKGKGRGDGR